MQKQYQAPFTKKQIAIIFKIAFLEAMALSIIIPTVTSTGEIQNNSCPIAPPSPCDTLAQSSSYSCSFSATSSCAHTTSFSPIYSVTPQFISQLIAPNTGLPISHFQLATVPFVSEGNGTRNGTWGNMPSGVITELFGDTNHRHYVDFSGVQDMEFEVSCPVATTGIAYLVPQYSTDNGATWLYFRTGTTTDDTTFDAFIDGVSSSKGNCGTGLPVVVTNFPPIGATHPLSASTGAGPEYVRIVGFDINAGDSPVFIEVTVVTFKNIQVTCAQSLLQLTNTQFQINIICSDSITLNIQVYWTSWILA